MTGLSAQNLRKSKRKKMPSFPAPAARVPPGQAQAPRIILSAQKADSANAYFCKAPLADWSADTLVIIILGWKKQLETTICVDGTRGRPLMTLIVSEIALKSNTKKRGRLPRHKVLSSYFKNKKKLQYWLQDLHIQPFMRVLNLRLVKMQTLRLFGKYFLW